MTPLSFPQHGIKITQESNGLLVCKHGDYYTAKHLRLSSDVQQIITDAINAGFTKLRGRNHPRDANKTPHYICFARPEHEQWDFLISNRHFDKNTGKVDWLTVRNGRNENGHKEILDTRKIRYKSETGGGYHLLIKPSDQTRMMNAI